MKEEKEVVEKVENNTNNNLQKRNKLCIVIGIVIIIIIILLLLHSCGNGKKYKIKLHYGNELVEVDKDFDLSKLDVDGGEVTFLVDSTGHIVDPNGKLDPDKEYSAHVVPNGKQKVKVTYKTDNSSLVVEYQKGAGLLFPEDPIKKGYVFIGWKDESIDDYPIYMMPVEHDMVLVAVFEKSVAEGGKCSLNCDINNDGKCDVNCDKNGDGKPDTNIDTDGDGKPDTNIDIDGDGKPDTNIDTNGDGKCDKDCKEYIFNNTFQDELYFDCESVEMGNVIIYFSLNKEDEFLSSKFNGKEAKPDDFDSWGWAYWNLDKYIEADKNIEVIISFIKTDKTGQKYFITHHATLVFEKNCDKKDNTEKENDDIPSTDGNVLELNYNCDTPHGVILYWEKDRIQSVTIDGKKANPGKYNENNYPTYDLREYKGSGKTIYLNAKVTDYENKDYEFTVKLVFSNNCDKKSDVINIEYTRNMSNGCGNEGVYIGLPYRYLQEKGLVVNENSTIKVLSKKLDGDSSYPYYDCGILSSGAFYWSIGRDDDLGYDDTKIKTRSNLIASRAGKTTTDTCQVEVVTDGQKYLVDLKFVAKYATNCSDKTDEKKTYTLTYNANGGSVSPKNKTLKEGEKYGTLPTPTRSGYTFNGWYTSASGGSKVSSNNTINANTTVHAHWTKNETPISTSTPTPTPTSTIQPVTFTLTYNANGGSVSPASKILNEGASYGTLPTPTRNGYTFDGWYTSVSGGNKVDVNTQINGNTTIYAHWKEVPQQDNGTISLTARSTCLIKGQTTAVIANVNNAIDSNVDWLADSCLALSSQGTTATVSGNNCGAHPTITGRLHNGAKDTVTFNYEDALTFTVTDTRGNRVSPDDGVYYGNDLTITTNIPAYIKGSYLSGDSNSLRTSAKTQGAAGTTVTITTNCGQTKTITISPIIN